LTRTSVARFPRSDKHWAGQETIPFVANAPCGAHPSGWCDAQDVIHPLPVHREHAGTRDLTACVHLADTLVERAVIDGSHAYWRFIEHRKPQSLLPPQVGWMQGAAGIAAFLFRASRVVQEGPNATPIPRMDTWWALPINNPNPSQQ
jgi:hypothetical protein